MLAVRQLGSRSTHYAPNWRPNCLFSVSRKCNYSFFNCQPFTSWKPISLCVYCHEGYDAAFSDWVLIPDKETLRTYIDHEKNDYEQRYLVSKKSCSVPPRCLPFIVRNKILYHPLIITQPTVVRNYLRGDTHWPKRWLGEPTTVIHRAVCHGLFNSNPIQPLRLGRGRMWQIGVPEIFRDTCWRADWFVGKATTGGPGQKPDSERKQQSHGFIKTYHYILVIVWSTFVESCVLTKTFQGSYRCSSMDKWERKV